eukprot:3626032-Rhodomonas_salina.4
MEAESWGGHRLTLYPTAVLHTPSAIPRVSTTRPNRHRRYEYGTANRRVCTARSNASSHTPGTNCTERAIASGGSYVSHVDLEIIHAYGASCCARDEAVNAAPVQTRDAAGNDEEEEMGGRSQGKGERERERERERARQRGRQRQRDGLTERQRDRETDRQTDRQTKRQRDREPESRRRREGFRLPSSPPISYAA